MTTQQLKSKLFILACDGLKSANRANPFWSKSAAMQSINAARKL